MPSKKAIDILPNTKLLLEKLRAKNMMVKRRITNRTDSGARAELVLCKFKDRQIIEVRISSYYINNLDHAQTLRSFDHAVNDIMSFIDQ